MKFKCFFGLFVRIIISIFFAGIFYVGWMAVAIPVLKSGPLSAKAFCWLLAPLITGAGFAAGVAVFELLPGTRKSDLRDIVLWPLAGCTIGAAIIFVFGPMLIVFTIFVFGIAAILVKEIVSIKKHKIELGSASLDNVN